MKISKSKRKPKSKRTRYLNASDDEKVERNWNKACGLFRRGEYSVAVIRCGTCVELAVNFAIRQELVDVHKLPLSFVDKLLKSANGLRNKYHNIFLPIMEVYEEYDELKRLWKSDINKINLERNKIVHSGEFRSKFIARKVMKRTHKSLKEIMDLFKKKAELLPPRGTW